jgi:hypothetical protein
MRLSSRDWIAWTVLAGIAFVVSVYYAQLGTGASPAEDIYRIVVTADRPAS